jgi:hypothetical protein
VNLHAYLVLQEDLKTDYYLWQVYHLDRDAHRLRNTLQKQMSELKAVEGGQQSQEDGTKQKRVEKATLAKQIATLEKKLYKRRSDMDKKVRQSCAKA